MSGDPADRSPGPDAATAKTGRGCIFIISAPSGAGKTTMVQALLRRFPDMLYSVSYTTREPRSGERAGVDYFFVRREEFIEGIENGRWAEWAQVHGNFYGTSAEFLQKVVARGRDILLDIDVQGTVQLLQRFPESVTIFIMPPAIGVLRERLEKRGSDSRAVIDERLANAEKEIASKDLYRYVVINDRLPEALEELFSIVEKYSVR